VKGLLRMNENDSLHFLVTMQSIDDEVFDIADAIFLARRIVPKIDRDTFHGEIITGNGEVAGVFRSNDRESRWFPNLKLRDVAYIIGEETL
jgi:hypothetical protein